MTDLCPEFRVVRNLLTAIVDRGFVIRVHDGEETEAFGTDVDAALDLATAVDIAWVSAITESSDELAAGFMLVYGNAEDGAEVIADHHDNYEAEKILARLDALDPEYAATQ